MNQNWFFDVSDRCRLSGLDLRSLSRKRIIEKKTMSHTHFPKPSLCYACNWSYNRRYNLRKEKHTHYPSASDCYRCYWNDMRRYRGAILRFKKVHKHAPSRRSCSGCKAFVMDMKRLKPVKLVPRLKRYKGSYKVS